MYGHVAVIFFSIYICCLISWFLSSFSIVMVSCTILYLSWCRVNDPHMVAMVWLIFCIFPPKSEEKISFSCIIILLVILWQHQELVLEFLQLVLDFSLNLFFFFFKEVILDGDLSLLITRRVITNMRHVHAGKRENALKLKRFKWCLFQFEPDVILHTVLLAGKWWFDFKS